MARHAQEERPLRSCHDSSDSSGGMCGAGLFAHAPAGYITPARRRIVTGASTVLSAVLTGSDAFVSAPGDHSGRQNRTISHTRIQQYADGRSNNF